MKALSYLPHLDGLRALAFTYVLLFHFRVLGATGGYLGVDIFLVLSGFLMTRILLRDISAGTFAMSRFIKRRFWRLYPSLLATVAPTLLLSLTLSTPKLLAATASSATVALLFGSNVYFQHTTGYFDIGTELKSLLHTWSLSLEEQFYLVWPPFLYAVHHFCGSAPRRTPLALLAAMTASFAVAVHFAEDTSFAFFALPPRIFEFAFGGLISLFYDDASHMIEKAHLHHTCAFLGAFFVNYPVFKPPRDTVPGPSSLMTLGGTALLILSPSSTIGKQFLSSPLARLVGKLSYTGYLVHWPLWVYALFTSSAADPTQLDKPTLFLLTFLLAYVLHVCVENPFRLQPTRAKTFAVFAVLAGTLLLSVIAFRTGGLPGRTVPQYNYLGDAGDYNALTCRAVPAGHVLFRAMRRASGLPPPRACFIGRINPARSPETPLRFARVLVGSSFAHHLIPALRLRARVRNESYLVLHRESCPLLADARHSWPWVGRACLAENARRMALLRALRPARVLLADFWTVRFGEGAAPGGADLLPGRRGAAQYLASVCGALAALGHNATVLGEPPVPGEPRFEAAAACARLRAPRVPLWWGARARAQDARVCAPRFPLPPTQDRLRRGMARLLARPGAHCRFFDQFPAFCDLRARECMLALPDPAAMVAPAGVDRARMTDGLLYWEGVHLNNVGAWYASAALDRLLDQPW